MAFKNRCLLLLILPLFLNVSCLYTRSGGVATVAKKSIKVSSGNVVLRIHGRINENVYSTMSADERARNERFYDNPLVSEGTVTANETKYLSRGGEYVFSLLPSEVITVNILTTDENDAEIIVKGYGKDRVYTLRSTDRIGLYLAFQNR